MKTNYGFIIAISLIFGSCNEEVLENNAKLELNSLVALSSTGIEFNAVVTEIPAGNVTEYGICYSSETDAPTSDNSKVVITNVALNQEIKGIITGLKKNTKYYVRFYLIQQEKAVYSRTKNATTLEEPKLETGLALNITYISVSLTGNAIANKVESEVFFEYGETTEYGSSIKATPDKINGIEKTELNAALTALKPNTNYHFRLKGVCSYATVYGEDRIFVTKQAEV
ncbi:MAG TPA: hypothetical protein DCQ31_08415, partial [Bacteroidales bacterium]|nr:hypothetical protein [Bacteroidales bacterium]